MIKKILALTLLTCLIKAEFIKIENFHPPNGYQPVKGYEPPNYQAKSDLIQTQRFNFQNFLPQNYEPRNQYESFQNNFQQPYQPPNQYPNYNVNNYQPQQNYPQNVNNYENNWQGNNNYAQANQNNQWVSLSQNNNEADGWRRTAPPTKFTTTQKWTGWAGSTTQYTPPPVTHAPIVTQPTTVGTTTVDWKQVFINSASTAKSNYIEAVQNLQNNHGYFAVDDHCLKCLCFIESWCSDVGCVLDQGSLSCGWYQLKYEYWLDCGQPGGGWKECSNSKQCAEGCVKKYLSRYSTSCHLGSSCPHMGRIHNGGPSGCTNNNTEYYGWLIERCLRRQAPYEKIDTFQIPN